jgi:N-acetylmuramoyl-L-alanine amidase/phosphatidylserine/phosphatidylglycerophosphate/cardiolipin synthase-like enzyme
MPPQPTVVIDPGHGGATAVGGSSPNNATGPNGLLEKDLTLDISRRVSSALTSRAHVILTRTGDENRSLADRAKVAHDANAAVFLSIHLNGWKDPSVDGSEAWVAKHASAASHDLARTVLTHVVGVTHARDRGVKEEDFGVIRADRQAAGTAASLVEVAFLTNPDEAERFTHDDYKQAIAQAIADGIAERLPANGAIAQSLGFSAVPGTGTIFLAPNITNTYTDYIQPVTRGDLEPLINGRSSNPAVDRTEPLDQMQAFVSTTTEGDSVYLAAWYFDPTTPLTGGAYRGMQTWGGLLAMKAVEGVKVRILATDFDQIAGASRQNVRAWMGLMDRYLARMPAAKQDNLQYVVSMHPATFGVTRAIFAGRTSVNIGSHHQKFMVVKRGQETIAFCGGLDVESRKTPAQWGYTPGALAGWHDIHVKMRGPIARDLEKEFALRWNRESGHSTVAPSPNPWSAYATLPVPSAPTDGETDAEADREQEDVQMERTVSSDATFQAFTTNQDNVKQIYKRIVDASQSFLYFENQYFRSLDLADWIVAKGQANTSMPVIFVVVFSAATDDGDDAVTQQGTYLQHEFFDRVVKALGSRAAVYTMTSRAVHSKFVLADDRYMTIGSANANERSFQLDSELNVAVDDSKLATSFRKRLWAHNLGVTEATVAAWGVPDFITQWDAVATANASLAPQDMAGEGVVRWDYTQAPGDSHVYIPDYLADTNADHGDEPNRAGLVAVNDAGAPEDTSAAGGGTAVA